MTHSHIWGSHRANKLMMMTLMVFKEALAGDRHTRTQTFASSTRLDLKCFQSRMQFWKQKRNKNLTIQLSFVSYNQFLSVHTSDVSQNGHTCSSVGKHAGVVGNGFSSSKSHFQALPNLTFYHFLTLAITIISYKYNIDKSRTPMLFIHVHTHTHARMHTHTRTHRCVHSLQTCMFWKACVYDCIGLHD